MRNQIKIKTSFIFICLFLVITSLNAQKTIQLEENFSRLIISPHIETIFVKGTSSSIEIKEITVPIEKLKYEFYNNNTIQVYLEGAKTYTKNEENPYTNIKKPIYKGRVAKVIITYTDDVSIFSIRGEEEIIFESPLEKNKYTLRFYGDSKAMVKNINVDELIVEIYGSSFLTLDEGTIGTQKIRAYGSSTVMASQVVSENIKISVYGDGKYQLNASEKIKVTSYGSARIMYKGNAILKKGIVIGESSIIKM